MDYRQAGVDIDAGSEVVGRIRALARSTATAGVLSDIGSFGGLFRLDAGRYRDPVLVATADGVGTKLKVAFMAGRHRTIGVDLVNHSVNDVLAQGAEPLFFLDYFATGRLSPGVTADVVAGMADACRENGCALLGGETAEMPGFYADGEYDIAGFMVGVVERGAIVDGSRLEPGDPLVALPSSGLHTNGYSLARRIVFDLAGLSIDSEVPGLGASVADVLLVPHRSYLMQVRPLLDRRLVKGMAHVTGGGITDNLPRILPPGLIARVDRSSWVPPPIFRFLQQTGRVPDAEMHRTFNMGVGLIVACASGDLPDVLGALARSGERQAFVIGHVEAGAGGVVYD
jgi:phosphoribosylformylglycinamidine cyclo-ligase